MQNVDNGAGDGFEDLEKVLNVRLHEVDQFESNFAEKVHSVKSWARL